MPHLTSLETKQRQTMRLLRDYLDRLPVTAAVARAVKVLPTGSDRLPDEVQHLAAFDPTLAIRMMYLANHTFLGNAGMPVTLGGVMARAGVERVVEGLRQLHGSPIFAPTGTEIEELWVHSIQVAQVARLLVTHKPHLGLQTGEAYLAGLVHDLGRFVMLVAAPGRHAAVADRKWDTGDELLAAETEVCGFTHTILGWLACRAWNFPDQIALVNRHHHEWTELDETVSHRRTQSLVQIVGLADDLSFAWQSDSASHQRIEQILRSGEALIRHASGTSDEAIDIELVVEALGGASSAAKRILCA